MGLVRILLGELGHDKVLELEHDKVLELERGMGLVLGLMGKQQRLRRGQRG